MNGWIDDFARHGEQHHPDHYLTGTPGNGSFIFVAKSYWCPLDEHWYSSRKHLARAIKKADLSNENYYNRHGEQYMPKEWQANTTDLKFADARNTPACLQCQKAVAFTESAWSYPVFCGSRCGVNWNNLHHGRASRAMQTNAIRQAADPLHNLRPTQTNYWVTRGFSEADAKLQVRLRQQTNLLSRFIERYGEAVGRQLWLLRQQRWQESLIASGLDKGYSKISGHLFAAISSHIVDLRFGKNEHWITTPGRHGRVDCYHPTSHRIIEFYGQYWHADPRYFKPNDLIRDGAHGMVPAHDKWRRDAQRTTELIKAGYFVKIVWEADYLINPDKVVEDCVCFLAL